MRRWRLLLAAVAALAAAWLAAPARLPLYDGVGFPDEPYRFVGATSTKPPTVGSNTVPVSKGSNAEVNANSGESGPQVTLFIPVGGLAVPSGATSVTVTATPMKPQGTPAKGSFDSNAYRLTATTSAGPASLKGGGALLQLRAPKAVTPDPVLERWDGHAWQRLSSARFGTDIYGGPISQLGDYVLVKLPAPAGQSNVLSTVLIVVGLAVLVLVLVITPIRLRRLRQADQDG